jgi:lipopolysaccharide transport protein LptA/LPS export ABC transporter protein LptC
LCDGADNVTFMRRNLVVYLSGAFIVAILFLSIYFFTHKPHIPPVIKPEDSQKVVLFKDVKYTGERKGVIDWEVRAKLVKQDLDKMQIVELEGIEGEYKPQTGMVIFFKGAKGQMDREKELATVDNVEVHYKGEYVIKSRTMDLDFKKSIASTKSPIDLSGKKGTIMGVGLVANMKDQVINLEKDVSGTIFTEKQKIRFSSDRFAYFIKDNTYILEGRVVVKGDQMNLLCDKVKLVGSDQNVDRADATGSVRFLHKGTIAKSERAVYYLKEERVVLDKQPKIIRDGMNLQGETIIYDLKSDESFVKRPKIRLEQQPQRSNKDKG